MSKQLQKGTIITSTNSQSYKVLCSLSSGTGQGDVYKVQDDQKGVYAFKLFHSTKTDKIRAQIEQSIKRGRLNSAFVCPYNIVEHNDKVGYTMEYIGPEYLDASVLVNGLTQGGKQIEVPFVTKINILYNIVDAVKTVNEANLGVYDIKFDNIKIKLDGSIKILDTDTIVYTESDAVVSGTVGFMPPNTMSGKEKPNVHNDSYALAVITFMTLFGSHPLVGRASEESCNINIDQYLYCKNPVYIFNKKDQSNAPIPKDAYSLNQQRTIDRKAKYPKYFMAALNRTFVDGLFDRDKRVSAREWLELFERLYYDVFCCSYCGEEHFFGNKAKTCEVCGTPIAEPIRICCGEKFVPLFNGIKIYSNNLWVDAAAPHVVFEVVASHYDNKFGLLCASAANVTLQLSNGIIKEFKQGDVIPIFLDSTITINNNQIKFTGGNL